ncbi:MAG: hypothetical protein AAB791_03465 [Patescibacteria group bacterium]
MEEDNLNWGENKKKLIIGLIAGVSAASIISLAAFLILGGFSFISLSAKAASAKAESFVNNQLLNGQGGAVIEVVGKEGSLYKLEVSYQGKKIDSYMTKDGKKFFPQVFDMESDAGANQPSAAANNASPAVEAPKSDKPAVELFVMSYCPYGTQIEKGIIPVLKALGDKIDFKLKFTSYTLHGEKENNENLNQYCLEKEQNSKLIPYLDCFVKSGDSASCLKSNNIDESKLASCLSSASEKFNVTGDDFDIYQVENDKYGVQGSPTLVINGAKVESGRDSSSLLKAICGAFKTAPSECQAQLPSTSPAPGFGE